MGLLEEYQLPFGFQLSKLCVGLALRHMIQSICMKIGAARISCGLHLASLFPPVVSGLLRRAYVRLYKINVDLGIMPVV